MSREAADLAREAAQVIQKRGMVKGKFTDESGGVCLHGALACAQHNLGYALICDAVPEVADPAYGAVCRQLRLRFPEDGSGAQFNDLPDTTATDVEKVLLKVADELELA
jgi:hypothetical protein